MPGEERVWCPACLAPQFRLTHDRARVSPTHIAFAANNRLTVRDCYAAALSAGGRPSGAPGYRNNDCSCFNAAAEDLDGNTIEFIYREPCESVVGEQMAAPSDRGTTLTQRNDTTRSKTRDDGQFFASYPSKAQSRAQTALDVASSAAKSLRKSEAPTPGINRSRTEPVGSMNPNGGKAIVGTLLGAAAGAAFAYAMTQSERDSARQEAAFASNMRSKEGRSRGSPEKATTSKSSHRNYGTTETGRSSRQSPRTRPAIEAPTYDDCEVQDVLSRYKSSARPSVQRSRTYDAIEYAPKPSSTGRNDRFSIKRASTMPLGVENYYIEGPKSKSASRHNSRRGSFDDSKLERHDSGVSMNSHRSRRSSFGKASTTKPARRRSWHESAANVPLPPSKATSYVTGCKQTPRASKAPSYATAAQMPLPQSRATSHISAAQVPIPPSNTRGGYTHAGEDSDGLGDMQSVVPDDSISCVDFSKPKKKSKSSSKGSVSNSKRSEANSERTVRPARHGGSRHSARTLPIRRKDDSYSNRRSKRSTAMHR